MKHVAYDRVQKMSAVLGEWNDCTVMATALACDMEYLDAHDICSELGRRKGGRLNTVWKLIPRLKDLGYRVRAFDREELIQGNGSMYTMVSIVRKLGVGRYIVQVRGHVAAVVDGEVLDWTAGRRHRVLRIWEIGGKD